MDALVGRLEAALSRLEASAPVLTTEQRLESAISRLETLLTAPAPPSASSVPSTTSAPSSAAPAPPAPGPTAPRSVLDNGSLAPSVAAFKKTVEEYVPKIKAAAKEIGHDLELSVEQLERALQAQEKAVVAMASCKKPAPEALQKLLAPLGEAIQKADQLTQGRRKPSFNHAKAVAESLSALTWVAYTEKGCGLSLPGPHIDETWPAAEFYTNKILVEHRNTEGGAPHVAFARALKELYTKGLRDYVKQYHLQGPGWAPAGTDLAEFLAAPAGGAAPPPPPKGAPPPPRPKGAPPPPPPGGGPPPLAKASGGGAPDMSKVFSQLNQGEAVTSGLKKVTADMKTKNRGDRTGFVSAAAPAASGTPPSAATSTSTSKTLGSPKLELQQDRKWVVEYQSGKRDLVISESQTKPQQTVYIFGCRDSVIQVQGKVNAITLDKCIKTALVFQDVVASCEVVNCTSVEVQCRGTAPCLAVDNTSGCQLYLSATALTASITTAKSSEVNALVPGASADENLVEHALPEQFISEFKEGKFVTTPVTHSG